MRRFVLAFALPCLAATARAELVVNGGFEADSVASILGFQNLSSGLTGWTIGSGNVDLISNYWVSNGGLNSIDLSGSTAGSISQTLTTVTGQQYLLSFYMAGNPILIPTVRHLDVTVAGATTSYTFDTLSHSLLSMGWVFITQTFTATGTSTVLTFTSQDAVPFGPALDDISVTATPEPGSLALFAMGLGALAAFALRRRGADAARQRGGCGAGGPRS